MTAGINDGPENWFLHCPSKRDPDPALIRKGRAIITLTKHTRDIDMNRQADAITTSHAFKLGETIIIKSMGKRLKVIGVTMGIPPTQPERAHPNRALSKRR